jgi:hypothetical protein
MKKILIVITVVVIGYFVCAYFQIGPLAYRYSICEKGYYMYNKNILDGGVAYYDLNDEFVGRSCGMYLEGDPVCEAKNKVVGQCTREIGPLRFFLIKKLGL